MNPSDIFSLPYEIYKPAHCSDDGRFIRNSLGMHVASWVKPKEAAFIVKACNLHDELLKVCKEALEIMQLGAFDNGVVAPNGHNEGEHWASLCREKLLDLIRKAEDEKPSN